MRWALLLLLVLPLDGSAQEEGAADRTGRSDGLVERVVEVEGDSVRALCSPGPVEVLLLHDDGDDVVGWTPVLRRLVGRVGACAWDRSAVGSGAGGRSDGTAAPRPHPSGERGWFELLDRLASVAGALETERPVWVGQGAGGLYARLVALDRPAAVGALVLLEPETEGMLEDARRGMPPEAWERWRRDRRTPNADGVRLGELLGRARGRRLPDLPVTVVTATERPAGEGWAPRWIYEAARRHQGALVAGVRLGRHVPAPGSGPAVRADAPGLVADEILRAVRLRRR